MVAMWQLSPFLRGRIAHDVTALATLGRYVVEKEAIAAVQKKGVSAVGQEGETGATVAPG